MSNKFYELLDKVDAAVFNGDSLMDNEVREEFRKYLDRWSKKAKEWDDIAAESEETGDA